MATTQPHYRESDMPDSPESKPLTQPSPPGNLMAIPPRSLSTGSTMSGMNGSHSPHSSTNGRTPSPPSMGNSTSSQQLPPACGARQLSKLKRFLTTLQQFGSDISPEIGERVRSLVLALVNNHLSIEEFHSKLQEATNFPLRPFVIPFLKANLPLLQRELLHCARMAKQTPQQYLAHNEHILFDPTHSPLEPQDMLGPEINENGKRRLSPDGSKENGCTPSPEGYPPAKHPRSISPASNTSRVSPQSTLSINTNGPIRLDDLREMREREERERLQRERELQMRLQDRERHLSGYAFQRPEAYMDHIDRIDDDWKHIDNMLHCIVGMVDKTRRALDVLRERCQRDREELHTWMRRHAEGVDQDMKKRTNEMMAHTLRQTEDRVTEVKRRAEEAVNEVKRQAVSELQKAVAAAEAKATDLVREERAKMERAVKDARKQTQEEILTMVNTQDESSESCWNCGRKASETCSGCNIARYCGSFCQHKDWENHHHVCGQAQTAREAHAAHAQHPKAAAAAATTTATTSTSSSSSSSSVVTHSRGADTVVASTEATTTASTSVTSHINTVTTSSSRPESRSSLPRSRSNTPEKPKAEAAR
ncbi:protein CBFA2T1-like [Lingula anatina]|uniref:Protein CBFA2T1-like n=1 Tax=Lingula anatina TaxID=7574 RepID=A0A1S3I3B3_LINAN|nr:protein CBFA2T1-like [Lingula anatina]|eukprot:XP_013391839.2 protein CBFA2T1-like [Lingula anatina]